MKLLFVVFVFFYSLSTNANTSLVESLSQNDKLIFIRHALAPGNGDPDNFDILDCIRREI
tara:strand:- start:282 stop:461 length:180 start_codon:yes stop_codon:yes gene_type:complete